MSGQLTVSGLFDLVREWQTLVIQERLANRSWDSMTEEQRRIPLGTEYQRGTRRIELEKRLLDLDLPPAGTLAGAEAEATLALFATVQDLTLERDQLALELQQLKDAARPAPLSDHRRKNAEAICGVLTDEWQASMPLWRASGLKYGTALVALHDAVGLGWAERKEPARKATKAFFRRASIPSDTPERSGGGVQ